MLIYIPNCECVIEYEKKVKRTVVGKNVYVLEIKI